MCRSTAFGREVSWKEDTTIPPGHQLTYKDALHTVTTNFLFKIHLPERALGLTKKLRDTRLAFDEIHVRLLLLHLPYRLADLAMQCSLVTSFT